MFSAIVSFFVTTLVIYICGKTMTRVHVRGISTAMLVTLLIVIFNFLIGWLLYFVLNLATLGIFYFTGLTIVISIIVNALIIELIDRFSDGFHTDGFAPSLWIAIILALVNSLIGGLFLY